MIEAHWLFGVETGARRVVIHPQSIVHSMVEFADGSTLAQLSYSDMCFPIQYAVTWPIASKIRCRRSISRKYRGWNFLPLAMPIFRTESREAAGETGGTLPA